MNYAEKYAKWLDSNTVSDNEKEILKKLDEKASDTLEDLFRKKA